MIRIPDTTQAGPALADLRTLFGYTRAELAQVIADKTGRDPKSVSNQLLEWERGKLSPTMRSLAPALDALGYQLALIPKEDA